MRTLVIAGLVALAGSARAEGLDEKTERARTHLKAGISYYDEGRYEDAAREMESAFQLKPLPDLQYNLAQCYERLGRSQAAADAYRKYLGGAANAVDRKAVEARIANLEERARSEMAGTPAPAPLPPAEKVVFKTIVVYKEAPPAPGRGARIAAYGAGVLALAALGSGIAFSVLAKQNSDAVTRGGSQTDPKPFESVADRQAAGQTQQIVAIVGYAVAGVAALGAVGLFALGAKIDREAPKLTLAPTVSPWGAGIALAGGF